MSSARLAWLAVAAASLGCASVQWPKLPDIPDVAPARKARQEAVVRQFDQGRDFADYEAALACWRAQDVEGCRERLESLLARHPTHVPARHLMAELLLSENRTDEAWAYLEPVAARPPAKADGDENADGVEPAGPAGGSEADAPPGPLEQGALALSRGLPEVAGACFREARAANPRDPQIPLAAALVSLQYNQPKLAVDLLESAVTEVPDSAALYRVLGVAYYRRGDFASSQRALEKAVRLDSSSALSYFLMGCALAKLGQTDAAESHFRQARSIDPSCASWRAAR